jgi:NADH:ubiquinone oxidoreductase subunit
MWLPSWNNYFAHAVCSISVSPAQGEKFAARKWRKQNLLKLVNQKQKVKKSSLLRSPNCRNKLKRTSVLQSMNAHLLVSGVKRIQLKL